MKHSRLGKPSLSQGEDACPRDSVLLAPAAKGTPPQHQHPIPKPAQTLKIPGYRVVVEVGLHDRLEPSAGVRHEIVHAPSKLLLNLPQLCAYALADRRAPHHESP